MLSWTGGWTLRNRIRAIWMLTVDTNFLGVRITCLLELEEDAIARRVTFKKYFLHFEKYHILSCSCVLRGTDTPDSTQAYSVRILESDSESQKSSHNIVCCNRMLCIVRPKSGITQLARQASTIINPAFAPHQALRWKKL